MNFFCYVYLVSAGRRWVCMRLRPQFRCAQERAAHRLKHSRALIEFVERVQSDFGGFTIQLRSRWRVVRIEISSELRAVIFQCDRLSELVLVEFFWCETFRLVQVA